MLELVVGLACAVAIYAVLRLRGADRRSALARVQRYAGTVAPAGGAGGPFHARFAVADRAATLVRSRSARSAAALVVGLVFGMLLHLDAGRTLAVGLCVGAAGAILPESILRARERKRREAILAALPDTLDLLAVAVQAGLGLDAALARITEATSGPLAEELATVLAELRMGATRADALGAFADRTQAPEVTALVRSILQAEDLGVPLGEAFATRAVEARRTAFLATEEKAGMAPVKMLFPTVFFIFPSLFVVILAPALLTIMKSL